MKAYTFVILLLLLIAGACKKEKNESPVVDMKITSYYPNSGNAGTLVTIEGEGFDKDLTRYTATVAGNKAEVVSATAGYLVLLVPAGSGSGDIELTYDGRVLKVGAYTWQQLSVKKISPGRGPVGTNIRIFGEGFSDPDQPATVTVSGNEAVVISLSDTLIIATVPEHTSTGPVVVHVKDKSSSGPVFKVQAIFEFSPKTGGKGTRVRVKGSGFETELGMNQVTFNGKAAQVLEATEEELLVVAPEGVETGRLNLRIEESAIEGPVFTVVDAPAIKTVTPLSGPAGTLVTIAGSGYSTIAGETKVFINNKEIPLQSVTANSISLIVPAGVGAGMLKVSVNDQIAEGPTFSEQALGITGVSPESGSAGAVITITGAGFGTNPSDNIVTFNGVAAQVNTATATQLTVVVPAAAATGMVKVRVNGAEAIAPKPFAISGVITLTKTLPAGVAAIAAGLNGELYAVDADRHNVLKIAANGTVSVFAGSTTGESGAVDGTGTAARFAAPVGIVADKQGNVFVLEGPAGSVRKITPAGNVTTYVASTMTNVTGLAIDTRGNMYVGARANSELGFYWINTAGQLQYNGDIYLGPNGRMGIDADGNVYAPDRAYIGNYAIGDGTAEYMIGGYDKGYADGSYSEARFGVPGSMLWNNKNLLLMCDSDNNALRSINPATKTTGTIFKATRGYRDGDFGNAQFGDLSDIAIDQEGVIYVLDKTNTAIRKVVL